MVLMVPCNGCNFFGSNWKPKHVNIGLFEAFEIRKQALAKQFD